LSQDAIVKMPETRYAKTADGVHIAYSVTGEGPLDLLLVMGYASHLERIWDEPRLARFLTRLASFSRLIMFDKRGMGLSDRVSPDRLPSLEVRMDDARAVLSEVGSERAVVFGVSEGGPMSTLFAATYPDRTMALILYGTGACWRPADDYPFKPSNDEEFEASVAKMERGWGTLEYATEQMNQWGAPSLAGNEEATLWFSNYLRQAASPGAAVALLRMNRGIDVRAALPAIHVPTLVLARNEDPDFEVAETKWMADRIRGAKFVSFPGVDHFPWVGNQDELLDEIQAFATGAKSDEADLDRMLATVMFTDIVGSTAKAAEAGDRGWRELLEKHHGTVRALLGRFRGREVDTAGDGFFATFDGPARAVRCAQEICASVRDLGLEVRAGVHTGEVEMMDKKVGGIAVNVGARVAALAAPSEVLVSQTVRDLVSGSGLVFEDAGTHELKGIPESWHLFRAVE
jgi:pimeloyl-ACP methyl ester carboxylesterase/class 3 adenylate cyclase